MSARLNVGDPAVVRTTHPSWNGRTVHVQEVRDVEPVYTATDGMDGADFHSFELEPITDEPLSRTTTVLVGVLVVAVVLALGLLSVWGAR